MREANFVFDAKVSQPEVLDELRRFHGLTEVVSSQFADIPKIDVKVRQSFLENDTRFSIFSDFLLDHASQDSEFLSKFKTAAAAFFSGDFSFCLNAVNLCFVKIENMSEEQPVYSFLPLSKDFERIASVNSSEIKGIYESRNAKFLLIVLVNALRLSAIGGISQYRRIALEIGMGVERIRTSESMVDFDLDLVSEASDSLVLYTLNLSPKVFLPFGVLAGVSR